MFYFLQHNCLQSWRDKRKQLAYYINQAPGKHITPSPIHHKLPHWRLKNISLPLPTHGNAEYIVHLFCSRTASRTCFWCQCLGAHLPSVIVSPWRWAAWAIHNTEFPQYRHHGRTHASGFLHFCWDAVDQVQSFCTLFFEHLILQPTGWSLYLTWQYPTSRSRRGDWRVLCSSLLGFFYQDTWQFYCIASGRLQCCEHK